MAVVVFTAGSFFGFYIKVNLLGLAKSDEFSFSLMAVACASASFGVIEDPSPQLSKQTTPTKKTIGNVFAFSIVQEALSVI
jgi:hypothetical protein